MRRLLLCCIFGALSLQARPFPIQFSIPEEKIVRIIPVKTQDFATVIPGDPKTYIFNQESDYFADYQKSYYAITKKKAGWDCLRHYEILASGCIPYFLDLDQCPENTMTLLPKELILEAMHLEGVSNGHIDHTRFDRVKYFDLLDRLLEHTRSHLTTKKIAEYILQTVKYRGHKKILYLTQDPSPDYLRCLTLIGFKQLLGERVVDVPKIEHIYTSYPHDPRDLYGKGFTYAKIVPDLPVDRSRIKNKIRAREFDLIIYGSVHRGLLYHDLVKQHYDPSEIIYLCGEDAHPCDQLKTHNLFLREYD